MLEWIRELINEYLLCAAIFLVTGLLVLISGYTYSTFTGFNPANDRIGLFIIFLLLAFIFVIFDVIYVLLKRRYKKKGMYKDADDLKPESNFNKPGSD